MQDNVSKIKDKLNIVDVVSAYLKLEKAGANLKAPCPFHNEKTPSFFISPDRGTFKCFGCGAGGDIFTFVEQFEGVDFNGALKILAEKAGVELVKENPQFKDERDRIYAIMEEATVYFQGVLANKKDALIYLEKRGISLETIKKFRIGFVENEWKRLYEFLKGKKYSDAEIEKAGLIKRTEKSSYDRFRSRIMFPIFDNSGRTIAFSGRLFEVDGGAKSEQQVEQAKYLNSPETILFNKSKTLYGYNFAKVDIRKRDFSILVEGQVDLILAHQSGFTNTVATSGTAFTEDHSVLLKRLSNRIMMAFDGDKAGLSAANRGAKLALANEMEVKLVEILDGMDPADFILKDKEGWINAVKNSVHIIDFNLNVLLNEETDKRKLGIKLRESILPLVKGIPSKIEQDYFVSKISAKTGISEKILWEELEMINSEELEKNNRFEPAYDSEISNKENSKRKKILKEIAGILFWQQGLEIPHIDIKEFESNFKRIVGEETLDKILKIPDNLKNEITFDVERLYAEFSNLDDKVKDLFVSLEREALEEKRKVVLEKMKDSQDGSEIHTKLMGEYNELSKKIDIKKN